MKGLDRFWFAVLFVAITAVSFSACSDSESSSTRNDADIDTYENTDSLACDKNTYPNLGETCEAYDNCYGVWTCKSDGLGIFCKPGDDCENVNCNSERFPNLGEVCEAYYGCYGIWTCNDDASDLFCKPDEDCIPPEDGDSDAEIEIADTDVFEEESSVIDGDLDYNENESVAEFDESLDETVEYDEESVLEEEEYHEFEQSEYSGIYSGLDDLFGEALKSALHEIIKVHTSLGYSAAREVMFSELDNVNGRVQCVYTGHWVVTNDIPPSNEMNTEHTWCQSWGAGSEPRKSDLHHLFPTMSDVNSRRSNHPFGVVISVSWEEGGSKLGYDENGETVFEPRDPHKGDAARAIFYFSVRYEMEVEDTMEDVLRDWNHFDPPDEWERNRNDRIDHDYQHNRNPFVDHPEFVDRIYDF